MPVTRSPLDRAVSHPVAATPVVLSPSPAAMVETIEARLAALLGELRPEPEDASADGADGAVGPGSRGRGRPRILPASLLWTGLLVCVLRGLSRQLALWRLLTLHGLWAFPRIAVSDQAIYRRLAEDGPGPLVDLFRDVTTLLLARVPADRGVGLAPFAPEVVVLDETTLDGVARSLPSLRAVPPGDRRLLPGKVAAVYDLRRQLVRHLAYVPDPGQNEKATARDLLAGVPAGSLVLTDLGYFGFRWFDELTAGGYAWLSRLRARTTLVPLHTLYAGPGLVDELAWLGAYRADRAAHLVRVVTVTVTTEGTAGTRAETSVHRYLTNVLDPQTLSATDLVALYARRWDIEQAVKLVKRDLGLHLLWSAKPAVVQAQVWAVLLIAQVAGALRAEVAERADCALEEVSLPLLLEALPAIARRGDVDPIAWLAEAGRRTGVIRSTRRRHLVVPTVTPEQIHPPPPDLPRVRPARYANRRCPVPTPAPI